MGDETPHDGNNISELAPYAWAGLTFIIYHVLGSVLTLYTGETVLPGEQDWTRQFFAHLLSAIGAGSIVLILINKNHRRSSGSAILLAAGLTLEISLAIMAYDLFLGELAAWKPHALGW
jgi:uncharacterized membrane protein